MEAAWDQARVMAAVGFVLPCPSAGEGAGELHAGDDDVEVVVEPLTMKPETRRMMSTIARRGLFAGARLHAPR